MTTALIKKIAIRVFIFAMLGVIYVPIIILIVFSFTDSPAIGKWDGSFTFQLYGDMFSNPELMSALGNTLLIAGIAGVASTIIGTFSAIGIYYLRRRPKSVANMLNQIIIINADIVTAVAFMMFFKSLGIKFSYFTLIFSHTIITLPFTVLSVLPRLSQLNPNLYEAGLDLGAGPFKTLFKVVFPQIIPAMISGFFIAFTLSLDDFLITEFNRSGTIETISTYLYAKLAKKGVPNELRALSTLIFAVSILILISTNILASKRAKREANLIK